jgi:hypothetical protein
VNFVQILEYNVSIGGPSHGTVFELFIFTFLHYLIIKNKINIMDSSSFHQYGKTGHNYDLPGHNYDLHIEVTKASDEYKEKGIPSRVKIPVGTYEIGDLRITCPMILVGTGIKKKDTKLHGSIIIGTDKPMVRYRNHQWFEGIPEPGVRLENMQISNQTNGPATNGPAVHVSGSVCVLKDVRITNCKSDGLVAISVDDDPRRGFRYKTTQAKVRCDNVKVTKCQGSGIEANGTASIVLGPGTKVTENCKRGGKFDFGLKVDTYYKAAIHIEKPLTLNGVSYGNGQKNDKNFGVGKSGGKLENIKVVESKSNK